MYRNLFEPKVDEKLLMYRFRCVRLLYKIITKRTRYKIAGWFLFIHILKQVTLYIFVNKYIILKYLRNYSKCINLIGFPVCSVLK